MSPLGKSVSGGYEINTIHKVPEDLRAIMPADVANEKT